MTLPTIAEIRTLHKSYAPHDDAFDLVYTHCQIVSEIAEQLLSVKPHDDIDVDLVRAGCLLHDIGVHRLFDGATLNEKIYITHGIEGHTLLEAEGYSEILCRFASRHTGVGLTKESIARQHLPLPQLDLIAESKEERLVMYADKFHSKHPRFNTYESYLELTSKWDAQNGAKFEALATEFGIPDLTKLAQKYGHPIV